MKMLLVLLFMMSTVQAQTRHKPLIKLKPSVSQKSIDEAIKRFNIVIPSNTNYPTLDKTLEDRGLTTLNCRFCKLEVTIGPAAFSSWAMLGSTLAHELEVHCKQNFSLIRIKDVFGYRGSDMAEREAYLYEIANAKRFGSSADELTSIADTMNYYYPEVK